MDTITSKHGLRRRLGRLSAVATISVALLAFGLSGVANANTRHTVTGQTVTLAHGSGFVVNVNGTGFASGAKIRIDLRYAKTNDFVKGAAQVTAGGSGSFSKDITVPGSEVSFLCRARESQRHCRWSGVVYARAFQVSSPQLITPWAETLVAGTCSLGCPSGPRG
jgi:hypothetical protein